jgi:hypothetical protein
VNKNTATIYIFIALLTIGTIDRVYGEPSIFSQKGMENVFEKTANLTMQRASRDHQASQRKAIEMVNKEKKHMEGVHFGRIAYVHPDYQEIFNDQKFYEFINNLPEEDRKICNAIVDRGSSRRVKALLSVYKQSIRREAEEKGENGKALQGRPFTYKPRTVSERKDDKMHGQGTYTYSNGDKYEGEWQDDKMHGYGIYTYSNGDKYEGEWQDDKIHGQGIYAWANYEKYVGDFKDGKQHGQGTNTYANGDKYVGEWKDRCASGGWFYWPNGKKSWSHENTSGKWIHSMKGEEKNKN